MKNEKLINALTNCVNHCNYCADACLNEDNVQKMTKCIQTDSVCAEVCEALKNVLLTSYQDVDALVKYCLKVCKACAEECGKHEADHCKKCAEACNNCAKECESYLA